MWLLRSPHLHLGIYCPSHEHLSSNITAWIYSKKLFFMKSNYASQWLNLKFFCAAQPRILTSSEWRSLKRTTHAAQMELCRQSSFPLVLIIPCLRLEQGQQTTFIQPATQEQILHLKKKKNRRKKKSRRKKMETAHSLRRLKYLLSGPL